MVNKTNTSLYTFQKRFQANNAPCQLLELDLLSVAFISLVGLVNSPLTLEVSPVSLSRALICLSSINFRFVLLLFSPLSLELLGLKFIQGE